MNNDISDFSCFGPTKRRQFRLDPNTIWAQVSTIVRGSRHVITHMDQSEIAVGDLHYINHRGNQQRRRNLVGIANHYPVSAHFVQLRSVLQSHLMSHILLEINDRMRNSTRSVFSICTLRYSLFRQRANTKGCIPSLSRGISTVYTIRCWYVMDDLQGYHRQE